MLADAAPEHRRRDASSSSLLLRLVEDPEHDSLLAREAVAHVGEVIARDAVVQTALERASNGASGSISRHSPGARRSSPTRPMLARTSRSVGKPTRAVMRRTCR